MNILSLSHNDLDGISSQIVLSHTFGEMITLNCGYNKTDEYLDILYDTLSHRRVIDKVFVTDLHFETKHLEELARIAAAFDWVDFTYIDHHDYACNPTDFKRDNLKIVVSKKFSATKITKKYMEKFYGLQASEELEKYVDIVDAYDLWRLESPLFKAGLAFNELFWNLKLKTFFVRYKDVPKMLENDKQQVKKLFIEKDKYFKKLEESGMIYKTADKSIILTYVDDFRSHLTLDFPDFGVYVNVTTFGGISIRISQVHDEEKAKFIKDSIVEMLDAHKNVRSSGGHVRAMGANLFETTPNHLIDIGKTIVEKVDSLIR